MDEDIKTNGWGIKKVTDVDNAEELINIFQTFYELTGRLRLSNELLVIPDGDPPHGEDRVSMKSLYDIFRYINSHGLDSLPFLGILQYYLEKNDFSLIKKALTELYSNLSYITLSGARDFDFNGLSDLTAKISFLLKAAIRLNTAELEKSDIENAYNINKDRLFVPKKEDPLDVIIDILGEQVEHKKMMHSCASPQAQTADVIETKTQHVDDKFANLKADYDQINDASTEQKKQNEVTDSVDNIIDESNQFQDISAEDIWIEDNIFDNNNDDRSIVDVSKDIFPGIKENDLYLGFNIPTSAIIDDLFEPSDDDSNDEGPELILAKTVIPQPNIVIPNIDSVSLDTGSQKSKKKQHYNPHQKSCKGGQQN